MKITTKMIGSEVRKNPIGKQETYLLAEENLANLKKRYQAVILTAADLRDSLKRRKKGLPDDDMRGYTDKEVSDLINRFQSKAQDLRAAIAQYEGGNWWKNPAAKAPKYRNAAKSIKVDDSSMIGYAVHRPTTPRSPIGIFRNKPDAMKFAREMADKKNAQFAVSRIKSSGKYGAGL
jgi:hypothetical protein